MNEYSHLVNSRARHKELAKQAAQARLGNQLGSQHRLSCTLPLARGAVTMIAIAANVFSWLRRG